ncbi:MAG TPA: hypothetical protein VFN74_18425 [Chloroflexota bacterium]|nr:hypothetical protein [Chloroflexota bacterium]
MAEHHTGAPINRINPVSPAGPDAWHYGRITCSFEYPRRLRAGFVGGGSHSWRNVYPTFQYASIDLVALADPKQDRALAYAKQSGVPPNGRAGTRPAYANLDGALHLMRWYDAYRHPEGHWIELNP